MARNKGIGAMDLKLCGRLAPILSTVNVKLTGIKFLFCTGTWYFCNTHVYIFGGYSLTASRALFLVRILSVLKYHVITPSPASEKPSETLTSRS
jgi:hypothetical protein